MAPFVLKFKGNKSFSPFSNLSDSDALTKTWRVCTKVAAHLEQGQRLENLSWRLWHLHNLMVETDNAKSKREFKKLSKNMGEKLDKDKGRSMKDLQSPSITSISTSTSKIKARAEEKQQQGHGARSGIKGMTFTFPVDPTTNNTPGATVTVNANSTNTKKGHASGRPNAHNRDEVDAMDVAQTGHGGLVIDTNIVANQDVTLTPTSAPGFVATSSGGGYRTRGHHDSISSVSSAGAISTSAFPASGITSPIQPTQARVTQSTDSTNQQNSTVLRFPSHFSTAFTPIALLCPQPTVKPSTTYGEAIGFAGQTNSTHHANVFGIARPTFEFALDELIGSVGGGSICGPGGCESDGESLSGGWGTGTEDAPMTMTNSVSSLISSNSVVTPVSASISMAGGFSGLQITPLHVNNTSDAMEGVHITGGGEEYDGMPMNESTITSDFNSNNNKTPGAQAAPSNSKSAPASPAIFAQPSPNANANSNTTETDDHPTPLSLANLPPPSPPAHHNHIRRRYSTTNAPESNHSHSNKKADRDRDRNAGGRQPSATAPRNARTSYGNSAPGGLKSECANCGASSTPLWRRGLNDELNCNACGLFAKLHKRPRPKTLRGSGGGGEGGTRHSGWASKGGTSDEAGEPVSCYNCATIATPLWRKDEEGRTLCNACGLYLKLHGERRPSSMKSDVIRKRSRHDPRRGTSSSAGDRDRDNTTPSATSPTNYRTSRTPPSNSNNANATGRDAVNDIMFSRPSPQDSSSASMMSPYAATSHSFEYNNTGNTTSQGGGAGAVDGSPVDLMSMTQSMGGTDTSVNDPSLGAMTFSPGATYQETLQYPGPFSLNYFYGGQYGIPPQDNARQGDQHQHSQQQQQHHHQQQHQHGSSSTSSVSHSPGLTSDHGMYALAPVSDHHSHSNGNATATQMGTTGNMWDQSFQVPMSTPYSFNYAGQVVQSTPSAHGSLGFVHPPMLPLSYWPSDTTANMATATKTEVDHEMAFGHH